MLTLFPDEHVRQVTQACDALISK